MLRKNQARFAETELDDEMVLMDIDTGQFFTLKGSALAIWRQIDGQRSMADIARALVAEYDVEPARCAADVAGFVDQMVEAGFVARG